MLWKLRKDFALFIRKKLKAHLIVGHTIMISSEMHFKTFFYIFYFDSGYFKTVHRPIF